MLMDVLMSLRYAISLILFLRQSDSYETWCNYNGEYFMAYEGVAVLIFLYAVPNLLLCGMFRLTMIILETRNKLHVITWYDSLINGNGHDLGLTGSNLIKFRQKIHQSAKQLKILDRLWIACFIIHSVPYVDTLMTRPPIYMVVYYTCWFVVNLVSNSQLLGVICALPIICSLSYEYFKLEYGQIKTALKQYMSLDNDNINSSTLMEILRKHNVMAGQVADHNEAVKWILGIYKYVCSPIAAMSIYFACTGSLDVPFVKETMVIVNLGLILVIVRFSLAASGVYSSVTLGTIDILNSYHASHLQGTIVLHPFEFGASKKSTPRQGEKTPSRLKIGQHDSRRQWYAICRVLLDVLVALRYTISLILFLRQKDSHETWYYYTGEYMMAYEGMAGLLFLYAIPNLLLCALFRLTMIILEKRDKLHVVTWYDSLINGKGHDLGLTGSNLIKFKQKISQSAKQLKILDRLWIACFIIHSVPYVETLMTRPPIHVVVYYTCWFVVNLVSNSQLFGVICSLPIICSLSYEYFKLEYGQIKTALKQYMSLENENILRNSIMLTRILRKHNAMADQVVGHNEAVKWILGIYKYVCSPIAAMSIYFACTGSMGVPFVNETLGIVNLGLILVIVRFSLAASGVHSSVTFSTTMYSFAKSSSPPYLLLKGLSCYTLLNSVQSRKVLHVKAKRHLLDTIRVMGGRLPVSFYCFNIHPYTAHSFQVFTAETLSTLFLLAGAIRPSN
ncbi:hypothetical protein HDE_00374 [Halotydeus destructor]|nr:hypothetical protein HDE_00374 [Halotydeus destructor]